MLYTYNVTILHSSLEVKKGVKITFQNTYIG